MSAAGVPGGSQLIYERLRELSRDHPGRAGNDGRADQGEEHELIIVLMGAAGAGKTTVGSALAHTLGWRFIDADAFHSPAHIEKIRAGHALTDSDRQPWLAHINAALLAIDHEGASAVLACSALRESYRRALSHGVADMRWVFLDANAQLLDERLRARRDHFAGPDIVESQLDILEPPTNGITLSANQPIDALVAAIRTQAGI
jgi:gluconokinase